MGGELRKGRRFGPSPVLGHPVPPGRYTAPQFCHAGWMGGTNQMMRKLEQEAELRAWRTTNPDNCFFLLEPQPSASSFLTLCMFCRTGVPPLDPRGLASKVISVNQPFSAISRSLSIILASPLGSAHIPCSIKQDSTASPTCPGAVPLLLHTQNHYHSQCKLRPRPHLDLTIDLARPRLRLADHSHLPSPHSPYGDSRAKR